MSDSWDPMSSKLRWTPNDFQSGARDLMISIFSPDRVLNTVRSLRLGVESGERGKEKLCTTAFDKQNFYILHDQSLLTLGVQAQ